MSRVTIRGAGHEIEILLDGIPIRHVKSFSLIGDGLNRPTRLLLDVKADEIEVETEAEVEKTDP